MFTQPKCVDLELDSQSRMMTCFHFPRAMVVSEQQSPKKCTRG
ncbi:hypothetical protein LEMLEM_LOCUS6258 [Lemmus lemmus]